MAAPYPKKMEPWLESESDGHLPCPREPLFYQPQSETKITSKSLSN